MQMARNATMEEWGFLDRIGFFIFRSRKSPCLKDERGG
jgi:hypothetical protein